MPLAVTILLAVTISLAGGSPPLMSTSFDGTVRLWDMERCEQSHQYPPQRELVGAPVTRKLKVLCSAVCPQTQLAAIGCSDNTAKVLLTISQAFSKLLVRQLPSTMLQLSQYLHQVPISLHQLPTTLHQLPITLHQLRLSIAHVAGIFSQPGVTGVQQR